MQEYPEPKEAAEDTFLVYYNINITNTSIHNTVI